MKEIKEHSEFKNKMKFVWKYTLLFIIVIVIINAIILLIKNKGIINMTWLNILVSIICSIFSSIIVSVGTALIIYFKFLKKIPENTEQKINTLLNDRLNYETSNHNSVIANLNPTNEHLSKEHTEIFKLVNDINTSFEVSKATYATLNTDQKALVDSVKNLEKFSAALKDLNYKNKELEKENNELKREMENQNLRNELKKEIHNEISKSKNKDYER